MALRTTGGSAVRTGGTATPDLAGVLAVYRRHAALLVEAFGEYVGCREIRKHHAWYFKGFPGAPVGTSGLGQVSSLAEIDDLLAAVDPDQPNPEPVASGPRGRTSGARPVALPDGWLPGSHALVVDGPGGRRVGHQWGLIGTFDRGTRVLLLLSLGPAVRESGVVADEQDRA